MAKKKIGVSGLKAVLRGLKRERKSKEAGFARGLVKGGLFLQRESQKIVPVDTGALKNSARTDSEGDGFARIVFVSYNTHYAVYVHEDLTMRHKPGKTAKYLERPAREKHREIVERIKSEMDKSPRKRKKK